jgi:hypothetical protein
MRSVVPTPRKGHSGVADPPQNTENDEERKGWIDSLKKTWARMLDNIESMMTSGNSNLSPKGTREIDDVMQLWGKVTWPLLFLTRLKSKNVLPGGTFHNTDMSILRRSIECASDSEILLNDELRTTIGLSGAYANILASIEENKKHATSFHFDRAIAVLADAVKDMQKHTGIYFEDNFLNPFTSLPVLAHLSTSREGEHNTFSHSEPQSPQTSSQCSTNGITFKTSNSPSDLVVISLRPSSMLAETLQHVYEETSVSLSCPTKDSVSNIARGVMFSDAESGIACLATSVLCDLGVELDDVGSKLVLKNSYEFFDATFLGSSVNEAESDNDDDSKRALPWDAAPDIDMGLEW